MMLEDCSILERGNKMNEITCPNCSSPNITEDNEYEECGMIVLELTCENCGHEWEEAADDYCLDDYDEEEDY